MGGGCASWLKARRAPAGCAGPYSGARELAARAPRPTSPLRYGLTNFASSNLFPAVDAGCETSDYQTASTLDNAPPLNISSNSPIATATNLGDATSANTLENARAHRVLLRGDDLIVAYIYTEDDALAQSVLPQANYNYWIRQFNASSGTWELPRNISHIANRNVDAKEPRLVGTPGSGTNCPTIPEECQNSDVFYLAWGTERKWRGVGDPVDEDIFITYTADGGLSFTPRIRIARGDNVNNLSEVQLRSTPDGSRVFAVWNQTNRQGETDVRFTAGTPER